MKDCIVIGDKTGHGATVLSASLITDTHGKYIACVGDLVSPCPVCKPPMPGVILTGDTTTTIDGRHPAIPGSKVSNCLKALESSQKVTRFAA
jgi:uncharacterized Zn-binding protein involved in type VI secretion